MALRPASLDELVLVASWIPDAQASARWAGPGVRFPFTNGSLRSDIHYRSDNSFCLEHDGLTVAFGQLLSRTDRCVHLARFIVRPASRGRGHGRTFLLALIDRAADEGYSQITLNVDRVNRPAVRLYESVGFGDRRLPDGREPMPDARFMLLDLPPSASDS